VAGGGDIAILLHALDGERFSRGFEKNGEKMSYELKDMLCILIIFGVGFILGYKVNQKHSK
jgi:hypothetical protein